MLRRSVCGVLGALVLLVVSSLLAAAAVAVTPSAGLTVASFATPSNFSAGENALCEKEIGTRSCDGYEVTVTNRGSRATDGTPIVITDTLPAGLTIQKIELFWSGYHGGGGDISEFFCQTAAARCEFSEVLGPGQTLRMLVNVTVQTTAAGSLVNSASVSGGGVAQAAASVSNTNGSLPPPFGVSAFGFYPSAPDGALDTRAGAHPFDLGVTIGLNNVLRLDPEANLSDTSVHDVRDVVLDLPLGFAGSALAAPTCTLAQLASQLPNEEGQLNSGGCPESDTRVGHIRTFPAGASASTNNPIDNVVPERGTAAEFGFADLLHGTHVLHASVVPSAAGYVLRVTASEIPQIPLNEIVTELFGNPAARDDSSNTPVAQFTNPADCSGAPLSAAVHVDSWQAPGRVNADGTPDLSDPNWVSATASLPAVTGCDLLRFAGWVTAQPETMAADSPSGLGVELKVPQSENPETLATPPLKKAVVTLPVGLAVNPSAAGGLQSCSLAQVGMSLSGEPNASQPVCPEASKIASVEVETPAVASVLQGSVYLATQNENPFHALLAAYIVVDDPTTGVLLKIPGQIEPNAVTGQLVATFDDAPQFPFGDLKLHFFGGPRAPLSTPEGCGTYTTGVELTPWSAPDSGPPATSSDSFQVSTGCVGGFSPSFSAGTTDNQAGAFSPLSVTFSRTDQDQNLGGVSVTTPPGVLGVLKGVERCPEPQAAQGTCGAGSLVGHTTVAAGTGPDPYYVQGGQVFLTGPYKGAPFGLSIVVPAVAGPFNLGTVVVRAAVSVDPHTAQITVASDPLPRILDGIPLDVRTVDVTIDRSGFVFNPTSCGPLTVAGALSSTQGASAAVSSRFQAANCQGLSFKPVFTVSTQAATSKKNGASLIVRGVFPAGEANIHSVAVTLPMQLPARLTTIQQACTEAAFNANPAGCPPGSDIGTATASTPILANPVTGPVYLVSHGGAAFPDIVAILQGEGVTVDLTGSIDIKHDITSSTFATVPDAPIASFTLALPEGPHSGLAAVVPAKAKGSLCGQALAMPFTIAGQNGAVVKENNKIAVTGCSRAKRKTAKRKAKAKKRGGKKG